MQLLWSPSGPYLSNAFAYVKIADVVYARSLSAPGPEPGAVSTERRRLVSAQL